MVVFGGLLAYSVFLISTGSSPGGLLVVGAIGLAVSIGDYLANKK